jgi:hypothetical protein
VLIYEVNLEVDADIRSAFAEWLPGHIQQILQLEGFRKARWFSRNPADEGLSDTSKTLWTIHYEIDQRKNLDDYLIHHAARMRQDAIDRFSDRFKASRRILNFEASF